MTVRDWLKDEVRGDFGRTLLTFAAAALVTVFSSVWATVSGLPGPVIAEVALVTLAAVLIIVTVLFHLHRNGLFRSGAVRTLGAVLFFLLVWFGFQKLSSLGNEIAELRRKANSPIERIIERESPNVALQQELAEAQSQLTVLRVEKAQADRDLNVANETIKTLKQEVASRLSDQQVAERENRRRNGVLQVLRSQYMASHDGLSPGLVSGAEWPPLDWMNERLKALRENFSVAPGPNPMQLKMVGIQP